MFADPRLLERSLSRSRSRDRDREYSRVPPRHPGYQRVYVPLEEVCNPHSILCIGRPRQPQYRTLVSIAT